MRRIWEVRVGAGVGSHGRKFVAEVGALRQRKYSHGFSAALPSDQSEQEPPERGCHHERRVEGCGRGVRRKKQTEPDAPGVGRE